MAAVWRGEIDTIVTWKADRLARNPVDGGNVQHALMERKVVIITSDRRYAEPDDQFLLNLEFGFSTKYSQDLAKNISRGLKSKWERGEWAGVAPIGYSNVIGERERRRRGGAIVADLDTAPYVQKLFGLYATGNYSLRQLTAKALQEWRMTFRRSGDTRAVGRYPMTTIAQILKNPFYYGVMRVKGNFYPGVHEPLISKATYDTVQRVLAARRGTAERPSRHTFPYSALIVCSLCGHRFTAYTTRKPSGRTYTYYRCAMGSKGCAQPHITAAEIEAVVRPLLKDIALTERESSRCIDIYHELVRGDRESDGKEIAKCRAMAAGIVRRSSRLLDLFIAGEITKDEKDVKARELAEMRSSLDLQIQQLERGESRDIGQYENFLRSLTDVEKVFSAAESDEKRALLRSLQIELRATPKKLLLSAGNATRLIKDREKRPLWCSLVHNVRTELANGETAKSTVASLRIRGKIRAKRSP